MDNPELVTEHQQYLIEYYQKLFDEVGNIPLSQSVHRRLCYVSLIDGLAGYCYPNKGNRDRFCSMLKDIIRWTDSEKVSLIQLKYFFDETGRNWFSDMNTFTLPTACDDIRVSNFDKNIDIVNMRDDQQKEINLFRHSMLFYKFRCGLVHELSQKSIPFPSECDEPFYVASFDHEDVHGEAQTTWNLHYPELFLRNLCQSAITNAFLYFQLNKIDPYENFKIITYWD